MRSVNARIDHGYYRPTAVESELMREIGFDQRNAGSQRRCQQQVLEDAYRRRRRRLELGKGVRVDLEGDEWRVRELVDEAMVTGAERGPQTLALRSDFRLPLANLLGRSAAPSDWPGARRGELHDDACSPFARDTISYDLRHRG
jgi:hypothetical protein